MRSGLVHWISHKRSPINCVDVQPNGYRLITGGDDETIKIWNLLPILSDKYEEEGGETEMSDSANEDGEQNEFTAAFEFDI